MNKRNQTTVLATDAQIVYGIAEELQNLSNIHLAAKAFTPKSLLDFFQARIDAAYRLHLARGEWRAASRAYATLDKQARPVEAGLRALVFALFGAKSLQAASFGFKRKERRKLTTAENVAAAAKRKATRIARGTLGKRQRALLESR